ncbi:Hypothetical predicted protein [Paramuricea clavata]|nr:Hypothetical predicted protein [Paramuricea clavata]
MATMQASSNKKEINKKFAAVLHALDLPPNLFEVEEVAPSALMKELNEIIEQKSTVFESEVVSNNRSNVDLVTEASGGRALFGIYHSEYDSPRPAGQPILLAPENVKMLRAGERSQKSFLRFTSKGAATNFFSTIKSTSSNVGAAIKGFGGYYLAEIEGSLGSEVKRASQRTMKSSCTSVSVMQYYSIAMKQFQIEEDKMNLTKPALQLAIDIGKGSDSENKARSFMTLYGSHIPSGVHTLGGIFCSIADAESDTSIETSTFTMAAETRLQNTISGGYFDGAFLVGGSVTGEHSSSSGKKEASHVKKDNATYRFSVEVVGPLASNPVTFAQLLKYKSTWAIIGRGPPEGYIPVWRLLRKQGEEFQSAADMLEKIWKEDEEEKRKLWEDKVKKELEEENKFIKVKEELQRTKEEFLKRVGILFLMLL